MHVFISRYENSCGTVYGIALKYKQTKNQTKAVLMLLWFCVI